MRKLALSCGLAALLLTGTASYSQDLGLDVGVSSGLYTNYVFRGMRLGPVGVISDAYATYSITDNLQVTGYLWNYLRLGANPIQFQETDFDGHFSWQPSDLVSLTGGYVYYSRANVLDTQEVYAGIDLNMVGNPYLYAYYDFDNLVGLYLTAGASHAWDIGGGWDLNLAGSVGLDFGSGRGLGGTIDGFSDALISTSLSYEIEPGLTVGPGVDLWFPSSNRDPGADGFRGVAWVGFNYNESF